MCRKNSKQLQTIRKGGGEKKVRLNGDGKLKLLTGDEFMKLANQKEVENRELEVAAEHRSNMRYEYHIARDEWEMEERARKERMRAEHQEAMEKWSKQPQDKGRFAPQGKKPVKNPFEKLWATTKACGLPMGG